MPDIALARARIEGELQGAAAEGVEAEAGPLEALSVEPVEPVPDSIHGGDQRAEGGVWGEREGRGPLAGGGGRRRGKRRL